MDQTLSDLIDSAVTSNRGRPASFEAFYVRDLGEADRALIDSPPKHLSLPAVPSIQTMRHRHHSAARLIAEGRPSVEIMSITGYSGSRLSVLKQSPDFQELVASYRAQKDALYLDVHGRKASLMVSLIDELADRLEDNPTKFQVREIGELIKVLDEKTEPPTAPGGIQVNINFAAVPTGHTERQKPDPQTIEGEVIEP
jgi:hypothetical protein